MIKTKVNFPIVNVAASSVPVIKIKRADVSHLAFHDFTNLSLIIPSSENIEPITVGDGTALITGCMWAKHHINILVLSTFGINKKRLPPSVVIRIQYENSFILSRGYFFVETEKCNGTKTS